MDEICKRIDICESSVGKEYLYLSLHRLMLSQDNLKERSDKAEYIRADVKHTGRIQKIFKDLGRSKKISFKDYIFRLSELEEKSNIKHIILGILLLIAIGLIFIRPLIGVAALVVMFIINILDYFKEKGKIEGYFLCVKYLCRMVQCAGRFAKIGFDGTPFENDAKRAAELYRSFGDVSRGSWLITTSVSGSLVDVVMDYIRMLFHVDLIKFNSSLKKIIQKSEEVNELYDLLGEIELAFCIAKLRDDLDIWCIPQFDHHTSYEKHLEFKDIYHLLIEKPVTNSLETDRSILLTGSNASGKSTFLKSIAISQIFAQTIYTCPAREYKTDYCKVISSMALNDNILGNESYFVVEIRSIKRIFDAIGDVPVMCFIDEVLRGTNTKERIAASTVILKHMTDDNVLAFAATHDIELTELLEDYMTNYHFSENVEDGMVMFDYKLKEGPSDSRNAIRLLDMYGFDEHIVKEAYFLAK